MRKCYLYCRVSSVTDRQSTERQVKSLTELAETMRYDIAGVFEEKISGAKSNKERTILMECLDKAKENKIDLILFSELSRCGRAIWEVLETIKYCVDNGIDIFFQKEGLRLFQDGKVNSVMAIYISCLSFCAEKERENIQFRLSQGRELAKSKGVKMGRPKGSCLSVEAYLVKHQEEIKYLKKHCSVRDTAKLCGCSPATVQRTKRLAGL